MDRWFFAYSWGCNFLDVLVFSFNNYYKTCFRGGGLPTKIEPSQILMIPQYHTGEVYISQVYIYHG